VAGSAYHRIESAKVPPDGWQIVDALGVSMRALRRPVEEEEG
jgi:hypothetical protein